MNQAVAPEATSAPLREDARVIGLIGFAHIVSHFFQLLLLMTVFFVVSGVGQILAGFGAGIAGPSRDLLVRAVTPQNATGRVYGFVYSGMDCGQALGPLLFGAVMDAHHPQWLFVLIGVFQALALCTAAGVGKKKQAAA